MSLPLYKVSNHSKNVGSTLALLTNTTTETNQISTSTISTSNESVSNPNESNRRFISYSIPETSKNAIIATNQCLGQIQELISITNEICSHLITECHVIHRKIEKCSQRYEVLHKHIKNVILPSELSNLSYPSYSSYQKSNHVTKTSKKSKKNLMLLLSNDMFTKDSIPMAIQKRYDKNMDSSILYNNLALMDEYRLYLPRQYQKLKSHKLLYSNPYYCFQSWQASQLKKLKEIKESQRKKKYQKDQIDYVRQLRSEGPKPAMESIVSIASKRESIPVQNMLLEGPDGSIISSKRKNNKPIVELNWKERYLVNGEPTHRNNNNSRSALKNYYTSYIYIAQRRSSNNLNRLLDGVAEYSDEEDEGDRMDDLDSSIALDSNTPSSSIPSSTTVTPRPIPLPSTPSNVTSQATMTQLSLQLSPVDRNRKGNEVQIPSDQQQDKNQVIDRWDEGLIPKSSTTPTSISNSVSNTSNTARKFTFLSNEKSQTQSMEANSSITTAGDFGLSPNSAGNSMIISPTYNNNNSSSGTSNSTSYIQNIPPPPLAFKPKPPPPPIVIRNRENVNKNAIVTETTTTTTVTTQEQQHDDSQEEERSFQSHQDSPQSIASSVPKEMDVDYDSSNNRQSSQDLDRQSNYERNSRLSIPTTPPTPRLMGSSLTPTGKSLRQSIRYLEVQAVRLSSSHLTSSDSNQVDDVSQSIFSSQPIILDTRDTRDTINVLDSSYTVQNTSRNQSKSGTLSSSNSMIKSDTVLVVPPPPPPPPPVSVSIQPFVPNRPTGAPMSLLDAIRSGESKLRRVSEFINTEDSNASNSPMNQSSRRGSAITGRDVSPMGSSNNLGLFNSAAVNAILARRKFLCDSSDSEEDGGNNDQGDDHFEDRNRSLSALGRGTGDKSKDSSDNNSDDDWV